MRAVVLAVALILPAWGPATAVEHARDATVRAASSASESDRETAVTARHAVEAIRRLRLQPGHDAATAVAPGYERPEDHRR